MFEEWIQTYLLSLDPFLVIKKETYVTKQGVHVFNAWFILQNRQYGLLSVIHDDTSILGTMLPSPSVQQIGAGPEAVRKFDLAKCVKISTRKEDLIVEKRYNKGTLEKALEGILTEGANVLCGFRWQGYIVKTVTVVTHFWRVYVWDAFGLCSVLDVDLFAPRIVDDEIPSEMQKRLLERLGGVLVGSK